MTPISKKNKIIMGIVIIALFALIAFSLYLIVFVETGQIIGEEYVNYVIDGDTFKMSSGETIRLLCVNTPEEDVKGYEEAKVFLEGLILYKEVRLEYGKTLNQTDKYSRTLAFVYVDNLGKEVFVNKLIVESGFSDIYEYGDREGECVERIG